MQPQSDWSQEMADGLIRPFTMTRLSAVRSPLSSKEENDQPRTIPFLCFPCVPWFVSSQQQGRE